MPTLSDDAVLEEWAFLTFGEDVPDLALAERIEVNSDMLRCMTVAHPVGASVPLEVPDYITGFANYAISLMLEL
jgi:hypothetical protein